MLFAALLMLAIVAFHRLVFVVMNPVGSRGILLELPLEICLELGLLLRPLVTSEFRQALRLFQTACHHCAQVA